VKTSADTKIEVKYPLGVKLAVIISVLVVAALGTITFLVSYFISGDTRITAEDNNLTINARSANSAESELSTIRSNVSQLLDLVNAAGSSAALSRQAEAFFFERNESIAAVMLLSEDSTVKPQSSDERMTNTKFFTSNETGTETIGLFLKSSSKAVRRSCGGEVIALNAAPFFSLPVMALLFPWKENGRDQACVILFSVESLSENLGAGTVNTSYMVNDSGDLLVHPDFELVRSGANFSNNPLVAAMRKNNDANRQILYKDSDGKRYFGAYQKLSVGDIGVLTTVPSAAVFESVNRTTRNNVYLTVAVVCIAIVFILFYSRSISRPIKKLTAASEEIQNGNFDVQLAPESRDEIGVLTQSFVSMGKGLAERERLKDTFGRFTNREVAEKAARGEIAIGGERKECTIFFSDIRGFTGISDKLTPEEVVGFLNEYMGRMVECVVQEGGTVDKFEGDAIMAVWGAPVAGSPREEALHCVRAALAMRQNLREFNKGRGGDKNPVIRIGCGINSGPVIAGQIGSRQKMEYTVIGDAVNFASRTESLNKPLGTDILITENTWNLIKDDVLAEEMPSVTVKGKEGPCRMFAVVNMPGCTDIPGCGPDGPKSMAEIRTMLGIPVPDYAKVNLDEEEQKYKIQK
jgi:adenylate cyclase